MRILFIDIDTLRPDHMGCYGYKRNTTPNIDRVADIIFTNYYCSDAPCLPSRASLISGMFGIRHGAVGHGGTCADRRPFGPSRDFNDQYDRDNFNNIFKSAGLKTASVSSFPDRHSSWWFNAGLDETYNPGGKGMESGEKVLPLALDWLDRHGAEDNWFLHVHFWEPHTPYRAPAGFGEPFADEPLHTWIDETILHDHLMQVGPHGANEINMYNDHESPEFPRHPGKIPNMAALKKFFDGYDTGILYTDFLVGMIFDSLRKKNIFDDTAIIITSDHGENMGELGIYGEHATADYPTCRIPMVMKFPGGAKGIADDGLHYSIDLLPTMAELLGTAIKEQWDGKSFAETVKTGAKSGRDSLVLSQMAHVCQRSARFGDWLYIRTIHDGYHLFEKEMLFNIAADPCQRRDVKSEYPDICCKGAKIILDWHEEMMMKSAYTEDPMWRVMKEKGPFHARPEHLVNTHYLERLEATGRGKGAEILRNRQFPFIT
jgi:arylsulfatase A-like enzyme